MTTDAWNAAGFTALFVLVCLVIYVVYEAYRRWHGEQS